VGLENLVEVICFCLLLLLLNSDMLGMRLVIDIEENSDHGCAFKKNK